MLDAIAENQPDFHLIELLVMPLFMAEADALSSYSRLFFYDWNNIKARAGFGHPAPFSLLLGCAWETGEG
jgi:hypothetical protein